LEVGISFWDVQFSRKATSCLKGDKFFHLSRDVQNLVFDTSLDCQKCRRGNIRNFTTEGTEGTEVKTDFGFGIADCGLVVAIWGACRLLPKSFALAVKVDFLLQNSFILQLAGWLKWFGANRLLNLGRRNTRGILRFMK
jgi:hypothetical protein